MVYDTYSDGRPSTPASAYRFSHAVLCNEGISPHDYTKDERIVLVECRPFGLNDMDSQDFHKQFALMDHHHPGDPGYDCTFMDFWNGSSIGQCYSYLLSIGIPLEIIVNGRPAVGHNGMTVAKDDLYTAALDHCLHRALTGHCIGINRDEAFKKRCWQLSSSPVNKENFSVDQVTDKTLATCELLNSLSQSSCFKEGIFDFRERTTFDMYGFTTALCYLGYGALCIVPIQGTTRKKESLMGFFTPEYVRDWMKEKKEAGYTDVIGFPERGMAMATIPE